MKFGFSGMDFKVMLAVQFLDDSAYGLAVLNLLKRLDRYQVPSSSVYNALKNLEMKGFLTCTESEAPNIRGGKKKRVYQLTGEGQEELKNEMALLSKLGYT